MKLCWLIVAFTAFQTYHVGEAHICIIYPRQRGTFDISTPGSSTCTRHTAPCGGQIAQNPKVTYFGGSTIFLKFQQNLNHYEVGYPGYMDISYAMSTDMNDFHMMAIIGYVNEYRQYNQHNYSIPIRIPNIDCSHCVIRLRYISHKPGETPFYQCSDIKITKASHTEQSIVEFPEDGNVLPLKKAHQLHLESKEQRMKRGVSAQNYSKPLYGFSWQKYSHKGSAMMSVDQMSGLTEKLEGFYFGFGSGIQYSTSSPMAESSKYVMDGIVAYSPEIPYAFFLEHRNGDLDTPANKILWIDLSAKAIAGEYEIQSTSKPAPIVALTPYKRTDFLTLQIVEVDTSPGNFTFNFGRLSYEGRVYSDYQAPPENTYVNLQWASSDLTNQMYYVLMQHEDEPVKVPSRLYSYNFTTQEVDKVIDLDVSEFTVSGFQVYEKTGQLLAFSPGLFNNEPPAWSLVDINPDNGKITKLMDIAPAGIFDHSYGGNVINMDQANGVIYHVLNVQGSEAQVIVSVTIATKEVMFSQLTNLRHVHNLAFPTIT